jgi:hypothetical protein
VAFKFNNGKKTVSLRNVAKTIEIEPAKTCAVNRGIREALGWGL